VFQAHESQRQCADSKLVSNTIICFNRTHLQLMDPLCWRPLLRNQGCSCSASIFVKIVSHAENARVGDTHKVSWFGAKQQHLKYFEKAFNIEWMGAADSGLQPHAQGRGQKRLFDTVYHNTQKEEVRNSYSTLCITTCKKKRSEKAV